MRNGRIKLGGALCVAAMLALSPAALAQLPRLPSPTLPGVSLPNVGDAVTGTANGAPVMRAEIVAFSPTDGAITSARSAGFVVMRDSVLDGFDARIVVLRAPPGLSTRRALARLRTLDPSGAYDFNHIYLDSGDVDAEGAAPANVEPATDRAA